MDITVPRSLQCSGIVAALEAIDGAAVPPRRLGAARGRRRDLPPDRGGQRLRARRRQFLARDGRQAAAVGDGDAAGRSPDARGRRWACRWCCTRAIPTCRPSTSTCGCSSRTRREGDAADDVWWFGGGMDLTPYYGFAEDAVHFHRTLPRRARAVRRRRPSRGTSAGATSTSTCGTGSEPRGVGGIFYDDLIEGGFERCFALTRSVGDHFLAAYAADPRAAQGHALRRARARLPGLPPRALRRVQPGLGSRHAVRAAVERPHRGDPDVAAAGREVALRLEARAGHARGAR